MDSDYEYEGIMSQLSQRALLPGEIDDMAKLICRQQGADPKYAVILDRRGPPHVVRIKEGLTADAVTFHKLKQEGKTCSDEYEATKKRIEDGLRQLITNDYILKRLREEGAQHWWTNSGTYSPRV